jgi:uncharacterized protein YcfJ
LFSGQNQEASMQLKFKTLLGAVALGLATQAAAQVTFYEGDGFRGRAFTADREIPNFDPLGFNDRAKSAVVTRGRWEVCTDAFFQGRCTVLRPGNYESLGGMGMDRNISSVRPVNRQAYENEAPPPVATPAYEYRQRPSERLYQAPVTWVHAVVGPPEQRCWVERDRFDNRPNVGGAVAGAIIGGVLGHQIGRGGGRDAATVGGVVAGGAIGANAGGGSYGYGQDVQRCANVPNQGAPDYWDVTYTFKGIEHRVQMNNPPGPSITVNGNGEPRG